MQQLRERRALRLVERTLDPYNGSLAAYSSRSVVLGLRTLRGRRGISTRTRSRSCCLGTTPLTGQAERLRVATLSRPARDHERTLFVVEDQVSRLRPTACVSDAVWLPVDLAVKQRRVSVAIVVHEHELLAELVDEVAQIAARHAERSASLDTASSSRPVGVRDRPSDRSLAR